jgi:hypothetical protein
VCGSRPPCDDHSLRCPILRRDRWARRRLERQECWLKRPSRRMPHQRNRRDRQLCQSLAVITIASCWLRACWWPPERRQQSPLGRRRRSTRASSGIVPPAPRPFTSGLMSGTQSRRSVLLGAGGARRSLRSEIWVPVVDRTRRMSERRERASVRGLRRARRRSAVRSRSR